MLIIDRKDICQSSSHQHKETGSTDQHNYYSLGFHLYIAVTYSYYGSTSSAAVTFPLMIACAKGYYN